ncbi:MAG: hypothetical protein KDC34_04280 [Saprospiraceae bacterium]|nr:hypothetical protein [Saprospiraceae bacterium]
MAIRTIDEVLSTLESIIVDAVSRQDPLGYFAVLYQKVTLKVKEGIAANAFENGSRMEELDVVFAQRYLDAYFAFQRKEPVSESWRVAFDMAQHFWPIVLQHLLIGMNAHINLDLGVAAAEISKGKEIGSLKKDFNKINEILSSLVSEVQDDLGTIWPTLKWILQKTKNADDFLADFSMKLARDGAWKFANHIALQESEKWDLLIQERDLKVSKKAALISTPGKWISLLLWIVRLGERGDVGTKIQALKRKF